MIRRRIIILKWQQTLAIAIIVIMYVWKVLNDQLKVPSRSLDVYERYTCHKIRIPALKEFTTGKENSTNRYISTFKADHNSHILGWTIWNCHFSRLKSSWLSALNSQPNVTNIQHSHSYLTWLGSWCHHTVDVYRLLVAPASPHTLKIFHTWLIITVSDMSTVSILGDWNIHKDSPSNIPVSRPLAMFLASVLPLIPNSMIVSYTSHLTSFSFGIPPFFDSPLCHWPPLE